MFASGQAACLLLLVVTIPSIIAGVSPEDIEKIQTGIDAGKDFTEALSKGSGFKDFTKALRKMNDMIGPWVDGMGVFTTVLELFLPEDTELLDAMKEGFKEVNQRLDNINESLEDVVEAINWAVVKLNFQAIEQDIRLLEEKLKEVLQAPNPEDGETEFIRVYENEYHEAGQLLWDSIVSEDQVFSRNVLRAGIKYTDNNRAKMNNFMKGLIALLMKASDIEIGYEKFKEQDRGMVEIWKKRLQESQKEFVKVDNELEGVWQKLFRGEVDKLSKDHEGWSHKAFSGIVYDFLSQKYPWMFWFVLIYDDCAGYDYHCVTADTELNHIQFRSYGRNFMVSCTYPSWGFDRDAAYAAIRDVTCIVPDIFRSGYNYCLDDSCKNVYEAYTMFGVSEAVLDDSVSWEVRGPGQRFAHRLMKYCIYHSCYKKWEFSFG